MLVLSRSVGRSPPQTIEVRTPEGRRIVIHFLDWERGRVRVGFECEREVSVLRGELVDGQDQEQVV